MHGVHVERESSVAVVRATGELDAYAAPDLAATLEALSGEPRVLADLGAVSFLDSTALGVLVRGVRTLDADGSLVRIVLPTGSARRIFELTTLDRALPVSATRPDALAELDV
ncbi:MAG: STAS domain-containing protein [Gaiellaceae bacterium]